MSTALENLIALILQEDIERLENDLLTETKSDDKPILSLIQEDTNLIHSIMTSVYPDLFASMPEDKKYSGQIKNQIETITRCLQRLVAFGANTKNLVKSIGQSNLSEKITTDLINISNQSLNFKSAIFSFFSRRKNEVEFQQYLDYALTNPLLERHIKTKENTMIISEMKRITRLYEKKIQSNKFLSTIEPLLKKVVDDAKIYQKEKTSFGALSECNCNFYPRSIREEIENTIILQTKNHFNPQDLISLNYLSLGSGELLQDFIILIKLLKLGFKNIKVSLIEPLGFKERIQSEFDWIIYISRELNVNLTINYYRSIFHYQQTNDEPIDVAVAIDFENIFKSECFSDVMMTQSLLSDNGFFFFAMQEHHLLIEKNSLHPLTSSSNVKMLDDILNPIASFKNNEPMSIALNTQYLTFETWLHVLPMLKSINTTEIVLHMIRPMRLNYSGAITNDGLMSFNETNLALFFNLVFNQTKNITVHLHENILALCNLTIPPFDLCLQIGFSSDDLSALKRSTEGLLTHSMHSKHFIMMQYMKKHQKGTTTINLANGEVTRFLIDEAAVFQRIDKVIDIEIILNEMMDTINKDIRDLASKDPIKSADSLFNRLEIVANGAFQAVRKKLIFDKAPNLTEIVHLFLTTRINEEDSLFTLYQKRYKTCSYAFNTGLTLKELIKVKFSLTLPTDNNEIVIAKPLMTS